MLRHEIDTFGPTENLAMTPFGCIQDSRAFAQGCFRSYNEEHYHSGLALLTPAMVHYRQTGPTLQQRQQVLDVAYQLHPWSAACAKLQNNLRIRRRSGSTNRST